MSRSFAPTSSGAGQLESEPISRSVGVGCASPTGAAVSALVSKHTLQRTASGPERRVALFTRKVLSVEAALVATENP